MGVLGKYADEIADWLIRKSGAARSSGYLLVPAEVRARAALEVLREHQDKSDAK